jgi:hypothetical protein
MEVCIEERNMNKTERFIRKYHKYLQKGIKLTVFIEGDMMNEEWTLHTVSECQSFQLRQPSIITASQHNYKRIYSVLLIKLSCFSFLFV